MNRAELKALAKQQIKGNIGMLFLISLIIGLITGAASSALGGGAAVVSFLLTPPFTFSTILIYQNLILGTRPEVKDIFKGFKNYVPCISVGFFVSLFTFLWSLLFVIPGIVKSYSYAMSMYILADNPEKSRKECMSESMQMMDGHKMDLFVLDLSFIGWYLLGAITFGIALIWIIPYVNATQVNFYNSIKPVVVTEAPVESTPVIEEAPVEEAPTEETSAAE